MLGLALVFTAPYALARQRYGETGSVLPPPAPNAVAYWTVDAIDQDAKTVTLVKNDGKNPQKCKVTAFTKITIDGHHDKLENVQNGMKVMNSKIGAGVLSELDLVTNKASEPSDKKKK